LIEAEFGLTGFAVVVKLLQKIYGEQGYYCEWTNEVALLFAKKLGLGGSAVSEIVSASIKRGIFDKGKFDKCQILTSKGIQKRYFDAVSRRKLVEVDERYLLVNCGQIPKNADIMRVSADISIENADISGQRKGEERKGKESRGNSCAETKTSLTRPAADRFTEFWVAYPKKKAKSDAEKAWKQVKGDQSASVILAAVERQKVSPDWTKDNGKYIPFAASWLRGKRWEDEDAAPEQTAGIVFSKIPRL
jgi:hypothetical protein